MRRVTRAGLAAVISVAVAFAYDMALAQAMVDPMRPPVELFETESREPVTSEPVLQSVMITPTLKAAIINGELVKLGGKFGNARLVKISENEVVLKSGEETRVLKMYPGVEKHASVPMSKDSSKQIRNPRQKPGDSGLEVAR